MLTFQLRQEALDTAVAFVGSRRAGDERFVAERVVPVKLADFVLVSIVSYSEDFAGNGAGSGLGPAASHGQS
jgi:hypothetical protein